MTTATATTAAAAATTTTATTTLDEEMKYDQRELELLTYYKYQMNDKTNNK